MTRMPAFMPISCDALACAIAWVVATGWPRHAEDRDTAVGIFDAWWRSGQSIRSWHPRDREARRDLSAALRAGFDDGRRPEEVAHACVLFDLFFDAHIRSRGEAAGTWWRTTE